MAYHHTIRGVTYRFPDLKTLLAKATPAALRRCSGGRGGGGRKRARRRANGAGRPAAEDFPDRTGHPLRGGRGDAADRRQPRRADLRAGRASHRRAISATGCCPTPPTRPRSTALAPGLTPEMAAAVSKIMRKQDLILVARKCRVVTRFRNTIGLAGPAVDAAAAQSSHRRPRRHRGERARRADVWRGDAVIGINPASDSVPAVIALLHMLDEIISR